MTSPDATITLESIDSTEALRYLGCPPERADAATRSLIGDCCRKLLEIAVPRWTYRVCQVQESADGLLLDSVLPLPGQDLRRHLQGCREAVLFCATLSAGVDIAIRQAQSRDLSLALGLDAAAAAAIEQVCDLITQRLQALFPHRCFTARFSPGYGDLPLTVQQPFLELLAADRRVGLFATENHILTPRKSVTAIMGLSPDPPMQTPRSCADCPRYDGCQYRKSGGHCGLF